MTAATLEGMGADLAPEEPALVLVAHGSRATGGDDAAVAVADAVAARRPGRIVRLAYLSHGAPLLGDVLAALAVEGARSVVVVPLLLSTGVHATTDIDRAVSRVTAAHPQLSVRAAAALGPDRLLIAAVRERLDEAGAAPRPGLAVVLAAAGSSDPEGIAAVERAATMLRSVAAYDAVGVGFVGGAAPDLATAVTFARAGGADTVAVVPYLLGDGHFAGRVREVQGDGLVVTPALGVHRGVVDLVLMRYETTAAAMSWTGS